MTKLEQGFGNTDEETGQRDEAISKVAALILEKDLYRPLGMTSPEYRGAREAMLEQYIPLKSRDRAAADAEAHRRHEKLKRQGEK